MKKMFVSKNILNLAGTRMRISCIIHDKIKHGRQTKNTVLYLISHDLFVINLQLDFIFCVIIDEQSKPISKCMTLKTNLTMKFPCTVTQL